MAAENPPLVSVIMPVYNAGRFLSRAIASVLRQTHSNLELILIDDCSRDDSRQIMQSSADRDARIRLLFNEENQGVARTRNTGIRAASGEYIALLDSDDLWEETKLERQLALLKEKEADIAYGSVDFIDENDQKLKTFSVPPATDYEEMLTRCYFICSTVVIRAPLLKAHPFRTDFYHEDYLLWTELLALGVKAVGVTDVVASYRQITGSRSHGKLKAAVNRWRIYRQALGMSFFRSCVTFVRYAVGGVKKYYM